MTQKHSKPVYNAPILSPNEIVSYLKDEGIDCEIEDIVKPKMDNLVNILTRIVSSALLVPQHEITQMRFSEANFFQNPEMHENFVHYARLFTYLKYICDVVGADFNILDISKPDPDRVVKMLSGIINYMRHKDYSLSRFEEHERNLQDLSARRAIAIEKKSKATAIQEQKELEAKATRARIENLKHEVEDRKTRVRNIIEQQRQLTLKEQQTASLLEEKKRTLETMKNTYASLKDKEKKLSEMISEDPSDLLAEKTKLQTMLTDAKIRLDSLTEQMNISQVKEESLQKAIRKIEKRRDYISQASTLAETIEKVVSEQNTEATQLTVYIKDIATAKQNLDQLKAKTAVLDKNKTELEKSYEQRLVNIQARLTDTKQEVEKEAPLRDMLQQKVERCKLEKKKQSEEIANMRKECEERVALELKKQQQMIERVQAIVDKTHKFATAFSSSN